MQATYVEVHQQRQSSDTWWSRKDWLLILSLTLQAQSIIMRSSPLLSSFSFQFQRVCGLLQRVPPCRTSSSILIFWKCFFGDFHTAAMVVFPYLVEYYASAWMVEGCLNESIRQWILLFSLENFNSFFCVGEGESCRFKDEGCSNETWSETHIYLQAHTTFGFWGVWPHTCDG